MQYMYILRHVIRKLKNEKTQREKEREREGGGGGGEESREIRIINFLRFFQSILYQSSQIRSGLYQSNRRTNTIKTRIRRR